MRVVALQGVENTGKTNTLNKLIDLIHGSTEFIVEELCSVYERNPNNQDRVCWCLYKGVKIGITTRGDYKGCLHTDFCGTSRRNFQDRDIVICAMRSTGGSVDFVYDQDPDPIVLQKQRVQADFDRINTLQAEEILKTLTAFAASLKKG